MRRTFTALLLGPGVALIAPAPAIGQQAWLRESDAARAMFPDSTGAAARTLELTSAELAALSEKLGRKVELRVYRYLAVKGAAGKLGDIFILDVVGQSQPITFAVGVATDGAMQDIQVMAYREPQGDAIQEKRFRKQFTGKRAEDPITLDKDIDAISGATISSRSATFAARKGLLLAELLRARPAEAGKP